MKVWMLTHDGEGMPTNTTLFRESRPPSTERISEFFFKSLVGEDRDLTNKDITYYRNRANEMASSLSKESYWVDRSGYESASLTLTNVE